MYQQLQKICRGKFAAWKLFGEIWAKYPLHPQKLPAVTPSGVSMESGAHGKD